MNVCHVPGNRIILINETDIVPGFMELFQIGERETLSDINYI